MKTNANSKFQALNNKQALITKLQNSKQQDSFFENLDLGFRICLGFRISSLGFDRANARLL
ncbi:MAG TPA: hypothetical protein VF399_04650 [bacterium]